METAKYIGSDPAIQHGKPCFRINGKVSRIPVYVVLELLEAGKSAQEITSRDYYPDLTPSHIEAALHYAAELTKNWEYTLFEKT